MAHFWRSVGSRQLRSVHFPLGSYSSCAHCQGPIQIQESFWPIWSYLACARPSRNTKALFAPDRHLENFLKLCDDSEGGRKKCWRLDFWQILARTLLTGWQILKPGSMKWINWNSAKKNYRVVHDYMVGSLNHSGKAKWNCNCRASLGEMIPNSISNDSCWCAFEILPFKFNKKNLIICFQQVMLKIALNTCFNIWANAHVAEP